MWRDAVALFPMQRCGCQVRGRLGWEAFCHGTRSSWLCCSVADDKPTYRQDDASLHRLCGWLSVERVFPWKMEASGPMWTLVYVLPRSTKG